MNHDSLGYEPGTFPRELQIRRVPIVKGDISL
jgi:hypothetical protein